MTSAPTSDGHDWLMRKLTEHGCWFNLTAIDQLLDLSRKWPAFPLMDRGDFENGIEVVLKNKVVDATALADLDTQFAMWKLIFEHPPR